ncbi:TonB-dependent receptor domain-containing protein [Brevundimonas sp.]|uniref:TonB-dependent receptor domain-containing protein n=1 Tax=Brevundimonas sp. TaxID=1871086 RepID=UPI0035ADC895
MSVRPALLAAVSLSAIAAATAAHSQEEPVTRLDEIVVTADPLGRRANEVINNVAVLRGDALVHRRQSTLGETLSGTPGVSSDTFGGGASRPVIRGQTSPRVRVLSDGAGLTDASEVSPDHNVTGEPLLLEGVEILRGPSALIYGGGAIGGAVNLIDKKVPTSIPVGGIEAVGEARFGTADDERAGVVGATFGAGNLAFRLEGAVRRTDDYEVPFYTPPHEDHAHDEEDHDHADEDHGDEDHEDEHEEEGFDRVEGSFNDTRTLTAGVSWIGTRGYLGAAFTEQRSEYGLPGHSHAHAECHAHVDHLHCDDHGEEDDHDHDHEEEEHEHEEGEAPPVIDLRSRRLDVRGEIENPMAGIERARLRAGWTDYTHSEIEGGEVGTTFNNKGYDGRVEITHAPIAGWRGVFGGQASRSDFEAVGEEAFLPETITENRALFLIEEKAFGALRLEGAIRQEWQDTSGPTIDDTEHSPFSISASAAYELAPGWTVQGVIGRSERAPTAQELFADGTHIATNTLEIGTPTLDEEGVVSIEASLRKTEGPTTFSIGAYRYDYDGYIYANTLDQFEDLRLIRYDQADAEFTGLEGEVRHEFSDLFAGSVFGDVVRAELDSGEDLPRIPAARLGARGEFHQGPWSGDLEYIRVFEQDRTADFESVTPGHDLVNATVAYDFDLGPTRAQVYVRGSNLLDETILNHASYLAETVPLRGRNFVFGVRARF